ncbi:MAG: 30S ribosomal protein S6 [Candidatus Nealsonbacteria bacterium]
MKNYELTFLISPDLPEEEAKGFQQKINSYIQEQEGLLINGNILLKRTLAYPISKISEAYLAVSVFQLNPEKLAEVEKKLKEENQIIRYLITVVKKERKLPARRIKALVQKSKVTVTERTEPQEKKVELNEIDKKLEEILNES